MRYFQIPLFPLSAHLMPGGKMTLRIFEPRYIRMVKNACSENSGFVICMLNAEGDANKNTHIYEVGTFARVVDFDIYDDGLLYITVSGENTVNIGPITTQADGLRVADCTSNQPWCCDINESDISVMRVRLEQIFERYEELHGLYRHPEFDNPLWVINRWIELIPVDPQQKQNFISQQDCSSVLNFLKELVVE